jgi:hypothetical protein
VDAKRGVSRDSLSQGGSDRPADRSAARRTARAASQAEDQRRHATQVECELWERLEGESLAPPDLYSLELGSSHTGGRRVRPRQASLILGEGERAYARHLAGAAASCGTSFAAYRRYTPGSSSWKEERLVCQRCCGTRACDECSKKMRERECSRVSGNWRLFGTVGVPAESMTCRQAWYRIRRARTLFFKRLERHAARRDAWAVRVWDEDVECAEKTRAAVAAGRVRQSPLDYAWTYEPHVSGYPHLHFVVNACALYYPWLKKVWGECIGREVRWIKVKIVTSADGICRYLSKYISKTIFTLDLCAVMYRQRMWATSLPVKKRQKGEWIEEVETNSEAAKAQAKRPEAWTNASDFVVTGGGNGLFTSWKKYWPMTDEVDAFLMARSMEHRADPERQRSQERQQKTARDPSLWPIFDLMLECIYRGFAAIGCLTKCVKVMETCASAS